MRIKKIEHGPENAAIEGAKRSWAENLSNDRVYLLAYNLIRLLIAEAALRAGALPREYCTDRVGKRPGRIEPRAVKRRPKPYPRLKNSRQDERKKIAKHGHGKKLGLN